MLLLVLSVLTPEVIYTQSLDPLRLELNASLDEDTYKLIPCAKTGVLVFYQGEKSKDKGTWWHFALFNTQLQEQWILDTLLVKDIEYVNYKMYQDYAYLMFYKSEREKEETNLQIMRIDMIEGFVKIQDFVASEKSIITGFEVVYPYVYVGTNHRKNSCSIAFCKLSTNEIQEEHYNIAGMAKMQKIFYNEERNKMFSVIEQYHSKDDQSLLISAYDIGSLTASSVEVEAILAGKYLNNADLYFARWILHG